MRNHGFSPGVLAGEVNVSLLVMTVFWPCVSATDWSPLLYLYCSALNDRQKLQPGAAVICLLGARRYTKLFWNCLEVQQLSLSLVLRLLLQVLL